MTKELTDKVLLIYEYDSSSPLFAAVANYYLEEREFNKAYEIVKHGLSLYPNYPTAHIIMGKVLIVNGDYEKAKEHFLAASKLINCKDSLVFYNNKAENVMQNNKKLSEEVDNFLDNQDFNSFSDDNDNSAIVDNIDDNLEKIAKELQNAKIPKITDNVEEINIEFSNKELISEKLAEIYYAQGNFKEAADMYEKLILVNPEKEMIFRAKILEIKEKMG